MTVGEASEAQQLVSIDFFTVPTLRFQVLYVFLVLAHDRRRILHFNVTAHPTAEWTGQQLREAFPFDQGPRYLLRDHDAIFGNDFRETGTRPGHPRSFVCTALSLAESLYRAGDWFHSARVSRPCHRVRGSPPCVEPSPVIFTTITEQGRILLWRRTRPSRGRFSRRKWGEWWRCRKWADYIIATNDEPPKQPEIREPCRRFRS